MNKLTLRYRYDSSFFDAAEVRDDFGRLSIDVRTDRFSGTGAFWVQWQDVKQFGEALSAFPIATGSPIVAQWGCNRQEGDDLILRLEIAPANSRGELAVRFVVADDLAPHNRVMGEFLTSYAELDTFRIGIERLMNHEADQAVLEGH
ncbi:hypothetical protein WBP07_10510 [Novosphingobium sp. BL-8A]|uniref:hypothetical protein n=1 Tax=Novosphingobium sp. BL-8A TaxID=3127639 RepID=UPI0037569C7A